MYIAVLKFERNSYDYYGDTTSIKTITLEADTKNELNKLIAKSTKENVYEHRGDFNLLMSDSILISTKILKVQDE